MLHILACYKRIFQVFHMSKCFIWMLHIFCNGFQVFSDVFASVSNARFKYFIYLLLYVATVASGYCICLQWFLNVLGVFASVSDACFKCFICLLLYVATATSRCFKIERVLHMGYVWEAACGAGDVRGDEGDVRGDAGPLLGAFARCVYHLIWPSDLFDFN